MIVAYFTKSYTAVMEKIPVSQRHELTEAQAEEMLETLLENPDYRFLTIVQQNRVRIEEADTAREALAFARAQIAEREAQTFEIKTVEELEGVTYSELDYQGVRNTLRKIMEQSVEIGVGGDATVFVSSYEGGEGSSPICYKFSKEESTPRGRNPMEQELMMQVQFYEALATAEELTIGVPKPYYYSAMASQKLIAMERLPALSVNDVLRRKGSLPEWFDDSVIDTFCDDLIQALDLLHAQGLFHRDLHVGNIMVSTAPTYTPGQKLGYIIDFGLSAHGLEGMDPYRKESDVGVFTYADDYGRINTVRNELKALKQRVS